MVRPAWSGAVSFGLVTISVKMLPAVGDHSIRFRQIHTADDGLVRNRKICEIDGRELSNEEIARGYEVSKDTVVPLSDEDFDDLPLPTAKALEIEAFVDAREIDPIQMGDTYYLAADGQVAAKPYALLRKALERTDKVAIAKYAWSGKERLGMLRVLDEDVIALQVLHWPDEIRSPEGLAPPSVDITEEEMTGALALMDTMARDGIGDEEDEYRNAVEKLVEAKSEHRAPPRAEREEQPRREVVDIMAALEDSVRRAQQSRGESGGQAEDATVHEMPKKRTAKKAPAKKTAAKKATSKKTASKKTAAKKTGRRKPA
ncbi:MULTISPECIES: non-homologous end joining protein Ku [unclassified Streptomyces]|uniref:non-homologous end joining protein Ku n=1 Tax=unclassified Streptomyces TaxID=2593676 RepID=UPI000BACD37C|nr:Ku protein [Streptomyces sp. CLI2509]ASY37014.1 Ku protein [Streptomyces sp. CLI2509]MYX21022.1 Ku protein [Streptomyces sp. SID8380]